MDKISVALPVYNGEKYLKNCIDSILNQSYANIEIIVSVDRSNDSTMNVLDLYKTDSRIVVLINTPQNKGIFGNLNNALMHSTGKYVQIFCQDDVMYKNMLDEQVACLYKNPQSKMVYCDKDAIGETGNYIQIKKKTWTTPEILPALESLHYFLSFGCLPGNLSTVMLERDVLTDIGYFDTNYIYAGDFEYWIRIAQKYPIIHKKNCLLAVRQHKERGSKTLNSDFVLLDEEKKIYQKILKEAYEKKHQKRAANYIARIRGVQHMHFLILAAIGSGKWKSVVTGIRKFTYPFGLYKVIWYYFSTFNLRIGAERKLIK